jgi:Uma2 family endonuclease
MGAMAMVMPWSRELTIEDLADVEDDGHRYELIDGGLIVTPAPGFDHQICVGRLYLLLHGRVGQDFTVILSPFDYVISGNTKLEPDLLVARTEDFGPANLQVTPLLVIEILSPSTRYLDLGTKRLRYAAAGVPNYWIVDPNPADPSLTALALDPDGSYQEAAVVTGERSWIDPLFGATIVPARLVGQVTDLQGRSGPATDLQGRSGPATDLQGRSGPPTPG